MYGPGPAPQPPMYGPPPPPYGIPPCCNIECAYIYGQVFFKNTEQPIPGISIVVKDIADNTQLTGANGFFYLHLPKRDNYTIIFTDVDGEANGLYKQHTVNVTWNEVQALGESPLIIEMEEASDEA